MQWHFVNSMRIFSALLSVISAFCVPTLSEPHFIRIKHKVMGQEAHLIAIPETICGTEFLL
jgi:hypothetical protein